MEEKVAKLTGNAEDIIVRCMGELMPVFMDRCKPESHLQHTALHLGWDMDVIDFIQHLTQG